MYSLRIFASDSLMPIGQTFVMTTLYSVGWLISFNDSLLFLRDNLLLVERNPIAAGNIRGTIVLIKRGILIMAVLAFMVFSIGPITFGVNVTLKWQLSSFVFISEAVIFLVFCLITAYVVFHKLCPPIYESIVFLQEQLDVQETLAMRERRDNLQHIYDQLYCTGLQNTIQYALLCMTRVLLIILPHWFIFVLWFDMVCVEEGGVVI